MANGWIHGQWLLQASGGLDNSSLGHSDLARSSKSGFLLSPTATGQEWGKPLISKGLEFVEDLFDRGGKRQGSHVSLLGFQCCRKSHTEIACRK